MSRLLVEGWRFLSHSYAVVNQYQCLELLRSRDIALYHRDAEYYNAAWTPSRAMLTEEQSARIEALGLPPDDVSLDAVYRISVPYDLRSAGCPTAVFMTAELGCMPAMLLKDASSLEQALNEAPDVVLVTPSRWSRDGLLASGADPARTFVVPHGFDPTALHPLEPAERDAARRALGWSGFVFLNVSAMTDNKGTAALLDCFGALLEQGLEATLVLKGLDELYSSKKRLSRYLKKMDPRRADKVVGNLVYIGESLTAQQMARLYQAADVYVSPYLSEAFNMPALEAAACGLPLICSALGPTDDFTTEDFCLRIETQLNPHLHPQGFDAVMLLPSREHLVVQMRRAVEDTTFRRTASLAAASHATRYTWRLVVEQLRQVLGLG